VVYKVLGQLPAALFCMAALTVMVFSLYDLRAVCKLAPVTCRFDKTRLLCLTKDCLPALVYSLFLSSIVLTARFSLERYHGEEVLGYYGTVSTVAIVVQSLALYIFNPLNGIISDYYARGDRGAILELSGKVLLALAVVTGAAAGGSAILGKFVLVLLFGESIAPYSYLLIPAMFTSGLTGVVWFLGMLLTIMRSMKQLVIGAAAGMAVSIVLSIVLIPRYVFDGANAAVIVAMFVVAAVYSSVLAKDLMINKRSAR